MSRHTKSAIWSYYEYIDLDSAKCKKCERIYSRKGRTTTSLKNHLRSAHPAEYREFIAVDKARKDNKYIKLESATTNVNTYPCSSGLYGRNSFEAINGDNINNLNDTNTGIMDPKDSYEATSISLIDIKHEIVQEVPVKDYKETEKHKKIFHISKCKDKSIYNSGETILAQNRLKDHPLHFHAKNDGESLETSTSFGHYTQENSNTTELQASYNYIKHERMSPVAEDESSTTSQDKDLAQCAQLKKELLEMEYIEMRNYKMKLELWQLEQQLKLKSSKFTKELENLKQ